MSLISKLDYAQKSNVVEVVNRPTQATAEDFNEIKTVVNNCVDGINWIKSDEKVLTAGTTRVLFTNAYPVGLAYGVVIHNCYDSRGYLAGHTITNKGIDGFDVTVNVACTLLYLTVPKR